jgi:purine-cytosine permease-like protein
MYILSLISGVGGWFFYYTYLTGITEGTLKLDYLIWSQCVATCSLLFAISILAILTALHVTESWHLVFVFWPLFALALDPGYRIAMRCRKQTEKQIE